MTESAESYVQGPASFVRKRLNKKDLRGKVLLGQVILGLLEMSV